MNMIIELPYLKWLFLVALTLILTTSAEAQNELGQDPTILQTEAPSLRFENIGIGDGLKQSSALDIIQDSKGFIWVATQQGLHRYDGHEFKVYQQTPFDTTSLSESWVRGIAEAKNGDIWVATEGGGINRLDQTTGTFKKYYHNPDDSTSLSSDRVDIAFEDSRGDLWAGTIGAGLNRMRAGQDGKFDRFTHSENDSTTISQDRIFFINEDTEGFIWVGTANGLNRIHPETDEFTRYLFEPAVSDNRGARNVILAQYIPPGETDSFWLATGVGVVKLNTKTGDFERFTIYPVEEGVFNRLNILSKIIADPENPNILWVGGPGTGLARFDTQTKKFTQYRNNPKDPNSLSDNIVESLFTDRSGTVWVGTAIGGIDAFNPGAVNFTHLRNDPQNDQSIAPGIVWGVYEDRRGTLWIGSNTGFAGDVLTEFDSKTGASFRYQHDPNDTTSIVFGTLRIFIEDREDNFWIGSSGGLIRFDRKTKKATHFRHPQDEENRGRNNLFSIIPMAADESIFWIGSIGGLDRFDTKTGQYEHIPLPYEELGGEFGPAVLSLHREDSGILWAGTNYGLLRVSQDGEVTIASTYNSTDTTSINHNQISSLTQRDGENDVLWLATQNGGLNRFDIKTQTVTHYTEEDGLSNNTLYGVLVDKNNTLWMSSNDGISNFDPETETFRNYSLDDGLMALEYSQNAYSKSKDGVFYFGSGEGVTAFVPEKLHINEIPPQIAFTDVKILNESISNGPDSLLKQSLNETSSITLSYEQNEVTFDYVALHFANSERNTYSYQLMGFDPDWIDAGNKKSATYTNLPEGEYTFHVRAANADGIWNNAGISMGLNILPPWYRTFWAYGFFTAAFGFVVFGIDRVQRYRISRKEEERTALREATLRAEAENKRRADTEQLSKIGRAITSNLSAHKIIDTVYEHVNELMNAAIFSVGIYNKEKNLLDFPATKEKGEMLSPYVNNLDEDNRLAVWCFKNKKEIIIGDFPNEHKNYIKSYKPPIVGEDPMSLVYLPLIHHERVVGVITTQSFNKNAYTPYHINLLRNLATYVAIALDNASAYRKLNATLSELQTMQQQLVQQEKLASLGQLTAGIAHEIKNPLNFVNNFSELSVELVDEVREEFRIQKSGDRSSNSEIYDLLDDIEMNLRKIHEHGSRADSIVKSMLEHSRGGTGKMEATDINALIKEYVNLTFHGMRAGKEPINVDIRYELDDDIGEVPLIAEDFSRIVVNLVNNAFDAMREKVENSESGSQNSEGFSPTLIARTKLVGDKIHIEIEDNGPGIPDEMKDKILQPFFTTKKGTQGTGLGLSITNDIIKAHGGQLFIETTSEKGSTFIISIPQ